MSNAGIDWNAIKSRIIDKWNSGQWPPKFHSEEVPIDVTIEETKRIGYLSCAKSIKNGVVVHTGTHKATVTLAEEIIQSTSNTRSTSLQRSVSAKISSGINVGIASIESGIEASVTQKAWSSKSIANQIRTSMETKPVLELSSHAKECTKITVPYGLVFTLTMKGPLTVKRNLNVNSNTHVVKWGATNVDASKIKFDLSVDPQVFTKEIKVKKIPGCEPVVRMVAYKVKRGDTLSEIALKFKTSVKEIQKLNPEIKDADVIFAGQIIKIRTKIPEHKRK